MKLFKSYYHHKEIKIAYSSNVEKAEFVHANDVLVFNYGFLCSNDHWIEQISFFHSLGFKCLLHDYRFHHESSQDHKFESCSFKNIANDTLGLISHLQIKTSILIGHSMGVSICLEMARIKPEAISRMILISGFILSPQDMMFNSNIMDLALPTISQIITQFPNGFRFLWKNSYRNPIVCKLIHILGFNPKKVSSAFIKLYVKKIGELDPNLFIRLFNEMRYHDIIMELENIRPKCLILSGSDDKIIPRHMQGVFHRYLKDSELSFIEGSGHVPQYEHPEIVNKKILAFISR